MRKLRYFLRRMPLGMAGMIVLIVGIEGFIARNELSFRNPWGWDWSLADRAARKKVRDCEVLCFGDSLVKFGVVPRVLEEETGTKSYNLAVAAGQLPGSYFLFRRALESGAKPRAVVIDAMPHLLADGLAPNAKLWPELLGFRDLFELSRDTKDATFFAQTASAIVLPSFRDRSEIRNSVMAGLRGQPPPLRDGIGNFIRNWQVNRGAQIMRRDPTKVVKLDEWAGALFPDTWKPNPTNTHYLRRFLRLADSRGIRVYLLIPPLSPEVQQRREAKGRDRDYMTYIETIRHHHPEVTVLDARHSGYEDASHIDPIHLEASGASSLSHDLGKIVRSPTGGSSGWIRLPSYREPAAPGPFEDVNQSAMAIMNRRSERK